MRGTPDLKGTRALDEYEERMDVREVDLGFDEEPEAKSDRKLNAGRFIARHAGTGLASCKPARKVV